MLGWIDKWFVVYGVVRVWIGLLWRRISAGRVLIMWDKRALEKMEAMVGSFLVSVKW